ncbi:DUF4124 domain-containing protein [Niveibacterium sp. SC-1]|uniref:DUF4124 domain-containing protein n=1 Tax=Niveibacterium sp. SC-1 TaxID=3135646 RepID=UPI00311D32A2
MLPPRHTRLIVSLCLLAGALGVQAAGSDVYKWRDADGKIIYGDRPPQGVKAEKVEAQITTVPAQINTPNQPLRNPAPARPTAKEQAPMAITGATRQQLLDTCAAAGGTDCEALVNQAMEEAVKRQAEAASRPTE